MNRYLRMANDIRIIGKGTERYLVCNSKRWNKAEKNALPRDTDRRAIWREREWNKKAINFVKKTTTN